FATRCPKTSRGRCAWRWATCWARSPRRRSPRGGELTSSPSSITSRCFFNDSSLLVPRLATLPPPFYFLGLK
ncbi:hypothetical protein T492DRAFT_910333, partial [Pavlovales sp. CCMP2436]